MMCIFSCILAEEEALYLLMQIYLLLTSWKYKCRVIDRNDYDLRFVTYLVAQITGENCWTLLLQHT